jgi:hypothetical protein
MRNSNPKIVEILDDSNCFFRCKLCGTCWWPMLNPGGRFKRGSWQCPNGCKKEDL